MRKRPGGRGEERSRQVGQTGRGRTRDLPARKRQHDRSHPRGDGAARTRSAGLHAGGIGRDGRDPCGAAMAQELRIPRVVVPSRRARCPQWDSSPPTPGTTSIGHSRGSSQADPRVSRSTYADIAEEAVTRIEELGFARDQIVVRYEADMRYLGQAHEVPVEIP